MSTLSFLEEERVIDREERKLAIQKKLFAIWRKVAMTIAPWLEPASLAAVVICFILLGIYILRCFQ